MFTGHDVITVGAEKVLLPLASASCLAILLLRPQLTAAVVALAGIAGINRFGEFVAMTGRVSAWSLRERYMMLSAHVMALVVLAWRVALSKVKVTAAR